MVNPYRFYTYAYLREDRTPYYIGKGTRHRICQNNGRSCNKPKDKSRIIFLKQNLSEEEAFKHEKYMIAVFGRKDLGTGILYNRTDGGEGSSGRKPQIPWNKGLTGKVKHNEKTRKKMRISKQGQIPWNKGLKYNEERRQFMKEISKIPKPSHHGENVSKSTKGNPKVIDAKKKHFKMIFLDGRIEYAFGIGEWCKNNGYNEQGLHRFRTGERKKYKDIASVEIIRVPVAKVAHEPTQDPEDLLS